MNGTHFRAAGIAMLWQLFQMGGVKIVYMIRLLVLAIMLTPADFGLVAIATSGTGFLMSLTDLGMVPALVQAEKLDERKYDAAWTLIFTRSILVTGLTVAFAPLIASIFGMPSAVPFIRVLALRPLIESMTSIKVAALNRNLSFRPLAVLKIVDAVFNTVISIVLANLIGVWGMIFGMLGGTAALVILSYFLAPYRPKIVFDWNTVKPLFKFGGWILVTGVISMLGNFGLRIVISRRLGAEGLGLYFLAAQLAFLPSEVASEVIGMVAFPLFARLQSTIQQALRAFQAIVTGLMALLYPVGALIIVLTPVLVREVLGSKWDGTVQLIQVLSFVTLIGLTGDATIPLIKGFGQPYRHSLIELVQSSSLIFMSWIFTGQFGVLGAALAWLPAIILVQLLCLYFVWDIFHDRFNEVRRAFLAIIVATLAGAGSAAFVISVLPNIPGLVLAGLVAVLVTGSILWVTDQRYSLGLLNNIASAFPQIAALLRLPMRPASIKEK